MHGFHETLRNLCIHSDQVKQRLAQINSYCMYFHVSSRRRYLAPLTGQYLEAGGREASCAFDSQRGREH
jgi:hypothetical protein